MRIGDFFFQQASSSLFNQGCERDPFYSLAREFPFLFIGIGALYCQYLVPLSSISIDRPGVPFKGFHWKRCAEDLTSRFEARGRGLQHYQPRSKLNLGGKHGGRGQYVA